MAQKTSSGNAQVDLGDIIFAIASDVGNHWKSLVHLLGMDSRRDVQKIQHECSRTQDGSSSLAQRCTEHMFALWRSRLAQSEVADNEAVDTLIFALQSTPQLAHLADKCMDLLGRKAQTSQSEVDRQTLERSDSGVYSTASGVLTEPPISATVAGNMPGRVSSPQQGQHTSTSAVPTSAATATATATSVTHAVQQNETVTLTPTRDSSNVSTKPVSTSPYQGSGMTNVNSFGPIQPSSQPQPQASVVNVSSGGTPLSTGQQYLPESSPLRVHLSSPQDSFGLSHSTSSQQNSSPPSEQPQPPQAQVNVVPVTATAQHEQPPGVGHDQQQRDNSPKPANSGVEDQESIIPNVIDLQQKNSLFLVLDVCLRLRRRKMLAHCLGLDNDKLDHIMKTEVEPEEQSFQIIKEWIESKAGEATFTELKEALAFIKEEACLSCMEHIKSP